MAKEHIAIPCPCCSRLIWPRAAMALTTRPARRGVFALLIEGKKGGGWRTKGAVALAAAPTMEPWLSILKLRLAQAFNEWWAVGLLTPADLAMAGTVTTVHRPGRTVTSETHTWPANAASPPPSSARTVTVQQQRFEPTF